MRCASRLPQRGDFPGDPGLSRFGRPDQDLDAAVAGQGEERRRGLVQAQPRAGLCLSFLGRLSCGADLRFQLSLICAEELRRHVRLKARRTHLRRSSELREPTDRPITAKIFHSNSVRLAGAGRPNHLHNAQFMEFGIRETRTLYATPTSHGGRWGD
jgi:hypothetical protein